MSKPIKIYAKDADSETLKQFMSCYSQDYVKAAALMPDAHSGYVAPIGAVLATKDMIVPSWVGFDIGCGMIAIEFKSKTLLKEVRENLDNIYDEVKKNVPMGMGELRQESTLSDNTRKSFQDLIKKFERGEYDKSVDHFIRHTAIKHLGTLGGGNHFIELGFEKDNLWLIIHSGSRGVGHKIAEIYMKKAADKDKLYEQTYPLEVESKYGKEYLNVLDFCLEFALLNRMEMAHQVILSIGRVMRKKISWKLWANKNHNHAILEKTNQGMLYIHRKGATPAKKNERGIIPANMRDGTYLVKGLGNAEFLFSSSHGAGRVLSRTKARETFTLSEFKESMKGIKGTIEQAIIDEAPMAYKKIEDVMEAQRESVKVLKHIKPIINWKGK